MESKTVLDIEIVCDVVRLCQGGNFRTNKAITEEITRMYPNEPAERIRRCMRDAAMRLLNQHQ